jgi:hypothetical protein
MTRKGQRCKKISNSDYCTIHETTICAICLENVKNLHVFCAGCINAWIKENIKIAHIAEVLLQMNIYFIKRDYGE